MKAATVATRDQLCMILRGAGVLPLSTTQVAELMPLVVEDVPCRDWLHLSAPRNPYVIEDVCLGETHRRSRHWFGPDVYRHLASLEHAGLVQKIRVDGHRAVYWRWCGPAAVLVDELEATWAAS